MNKARSFILNCIFLLSAVFLLWLSLFLQSDRKTESHLTDSAFLISHESGFYNRSLRIRITPVQNASVYYTTDGSKPSADSASSVLYERPIALKAALEEKSYPLRFRLYFDDGTSSKVYSYSYILGYFVRSRYDTYVVNILGDPDALFGEENGVFTANYALTGEASERPVNFQIFQKDGTLLTAQDCGLRIFGNFSRGKAQKSFQLFARKSYDVYGKFHLSLFPDIRRETDGAILDRNNRLVFRNSGNDFGKAFLRDTLIQQLATDYGFPLATPYVPASVYINGEYAGFYWIKEPFSDGQTEERYGDVEGHFEKVTLQEFFRKAGEDGEEKSDIIADYQSIYDTYVDADLTDEKTYQALCKKIDVENYLAYYALEIYVANKDWPYNNVRGWRYFSDDGSYTEDSAFDGRYRYLLFDTDYGFGLIDDVPGYACEEDNIAALLNNYQSPIFCNLMERADCREKFTNYVCDLMNSSFSYASISNAVQKLTSKRDAELGYYVKTLLPNITTMDAVNAETAAILSFAQKRSSYVHTFLQNDYSLYYPYSLQIESPKSACVSVNSIIDAGNDFSGIYYADNALSLKASINEGHLLAYWVVNGIQYQGAELSFSSAMLKQLLGIPAQDKQNAAPPDGFATLGYAESKERPTLHISLVVTDNPDALPVISRIRAKGTNDLVELSNLSGHPLSLDGLYLSDNAANLKKTKLPDRVLAPGTSILFYGKKNRTMRSADTPPLDFNLRKGETLYLSDKSGFILEEIPIPDLGRENSDYVRNLFSGKFCEVFNPDTP